MKFLTDNERYFSETFGIVRIGLFGSYQRGDQTETSDIDLLVEFEHNTPDLFDKKIELKEFIKQSLELNADICREKYIKKNIQTSVLQETQYAYKRSS
ncbi:nucleotidyltransferase family protein [Saccharicrinis sp. FJH62]|uniref:nucleotidyltransferase family protein n=1 Tax=Saccharicrinis sp. FJH62 TaxID=3344657 RepID=UPI0035D4A13E